MILRHCTLCPRRCGVDRTQKGGVCGGGKNMRAARAALHLWEEPCISGKGGAGAIFFSGCALRCCYCQNMRISQERFGKAISVSELAEIMLRLQSNGAETIDLVTGSHYAPWIAESLQMVKKKLHIPVVWNSSGYDSSEILSFLDGLVDVYLPDWKYIDPFVAERYSHAADYCQIVEQAIQVMVQQVGKPVLKNGILQKGVLIRHLVLPGQRHQSIALLRRIAERFPTDTVWVSLMGQYTPPSNWLMPDKNLERRLTTMEYQSVLKVAQELDLNGFSQDLSSARQSYTPSFHLEGLPDS
jgi:putative pyruvate formate lyase activating enzyme